MDLIEKINQKIDTLESGAGEEDAKALQTLLSGLDDGEYSRGASGSVVKMMQSITKYLVGRLDRPHPDAIPLLKTLASDLETLKTQPSGNAAEERQILERSIRGFKSLKTAISAPVPISKKEFEELKAVILSVDWEISTLTLQNFDEVITRLKDKLKFNKVHLTFLQIMHSLGAYIAKNGAGADSDSIALIQSVFQNYEKLVQNPNMPVSEKKALIEGDIRKYNEFKQGVATGTSPAPAAPQPPSQTDEELPPALSHVGSAGAADDQATLSLLSDAPEMDDDILEVFGSQDQEEQPRDVMGDLFSPKTTPADELLDAIHLAELHGDDAQSSPSMNPADASAQEEGEGVKSYVPERGGSDPIPEIESRLDAFFNLDVSESSVSSLGAETSGPPAPPVQKAESFPADEGDEFESGEFDDVEAFDEFDDDDEEIEPGLSGLIGPDQDVEPAFGTDQEFESLNTLSEFDRDPMDDEDSLAQALDFVSEEESPAPALDFVTSDEPGDEEDELPLEQVPDDGIEFIEPEEMEPEDEETSALVAALEEDDPAEPVLERLKAVLDSPEELVEDGIYTQALEDIAALNQIWAQDPDRRALVEMISGLSQYVHDIGAPTVEKEAPPAEAVAQTLPEEDLEPIQGEGPMANPEEALGETEPEENERNKIEPEETGTDESKLDEGESESDATQGEPDEAPVVEETLTDRSDEVSVDAPSAEDEVPFDDEFVPEEVESKPKGGFWGRLTARFRK